ncbi:hypothetical protein GINT2_000452 [Glugoides intestinalis]
MATLKCCGNCSKAHNAILETSLVCIVNDFVANLEAIITDPSTLQQFYDYIKIKFCIPCETGMLFVEKIATKDIFDNSLFKTDNLNNLTNRKMELYDWITPMHLEIKSLDISKAISTLKKLERSDVPSVKLFYLMTSIKQLYNKVGTAADLDGFFPYLVYCFIKSRIKDLYAHIYYLNIFKRSFEQYCSSDCKHGFNVPVKCSCLLSENWKNEEDYYLTTSLAVVDYISKLEFYNLNIEQHEFDIEISNALKRIHKKNSKSAMFKN